MIPCQLSCTTRSKVYLKPPNDRLQTTLINAKAETQSIRIIKDRRPRGHNLPTGGVILELHKLQRIRPSNLDQGLKFVAHGRSEARQTNDTGVGEELIRRNMFGKD
jgi:hypothetical protein